MTNNVLLSYSGSGNHLVRFFIELLTEQPTIGWGFVKEDVAIHKATFAEPIPFNIKDDAPPIYRKEHFAPEYKAEKLIVIMRNPREVLVRQTGKNINNFADGMFVNTSVVTEHIDFYFNIYKYYLDFKGEKLLLFYEDLITEKKAFVQQLYDFLKPNKPEKLAYALENVDKLYTLSRTGTNRAWLGSKSDLTANYYYKTLYSPVFFDECLRPNMEIYPELAKKFGYAL